MTTFQSACEALKSSTIWVSTVRSTSLPAPWYHRLSSVCAAAPPAMQVVLSRAAPIRVRVFMVFLLGWVIWVRIGRSGRHRRPPAQLAPHQMRASSWAAVAPPRRSLEHQPRRALAHPPVWQLHGCELRIQRLGDHAVVIVAGDRHPLGHRDAAGPQYAVNGDGQPVVAAAKHRRRRVERQQRVDRRAQRRPLRGRSGPVRVDDQRWVVADPCRFQCIAVAIEPEAMSHEPGRQRQETDPPVTARDQRLGQRLLAMHVIGQDAERPCVVEGVHQHQPLRPGDLRQLDPLVVVGDVEQTLHPMLAQRADQRRNAPGVAAGVRDQQRKPGLRQHALDALDDLQVGQPSCPAAVRRPTDRARHQSNEAGAVRAHRPRRRRGHVAEPFHRRLDRLSGPHVDRRVAVHHPRYRLRGNSR